MPDENGHRFVAVLNKKIEYGRIMNALGHMTAGLAGKVGKSEEMQVFAVSINYEPSSMDH